MCGEGERAWQRRGGGFVHGRKACMEGGVCMARGDVRAGETATEAADMHPTGLI